MPKPPRPPSDKTPVLPSHPLFDTPLRIDSIRVVRYEATGQETVPRGFDPNELMSEEDIYKHFGGGHYELKAFGRKTDKNGEERSCILDRKHHTVAGVPKPLVPQVPAVPPAGPAPAIASSDGLVTLLFQSLMQMQSANQQMLVSMQQSNMQMMAAMQKSSNELMAAMLSSRGGSGDAATMALGDIARSAISSRGTEPAGLTPDKLFDVAHRLGKAEGELEAGAGLDDGGEDDVLATVGKVVGGFMAARQGGGGAAGGGGGGAAGGGGGGLVGPVN